MAFLADQGVKHLASTFVLMRDGAVVVNGSLSELHASNDPFVTRFVNAHRTLALPSSIQGAP